MANSGRISEGGDEVGALIYLDREPTSRVKVSSVLNRDVKQFGKKFMFDGNAESCWNSDQGSPQSVLVELPSSASIRCVEVTFQGGFAAREGILLGGDSVSSLAEVQKFYPADDNTLQQFTIHSSSVNKYYKVVFANSTDFYGRTVIYHLQFIGQFQHQE